MLNHKYAGPDMNIVFDWDVTQHTKSNHLAEEERVVFCHVDVNVLCLFLTLQGTMGSGQQCMSAAFPSHTHLLFD